MQCVTCVEGDFIDTLGSGLPSEGEEVEDDCDVGSVVREISLTHWGEAYYTRGKKPKYGYFLWSGEISLRHWGQVCYVQWGEKPKDGYFA